MLVGRLEQLKLKREDEKVEFLSMVLNPLLIVSDEQGRL